MGNYRTWRQINFRNVFTIKKEIHQIFSAFIDEILQMSRIFFWVKHISSKTGVYNGTSLLICIYDQNL